MPTHEVTNQVPPLAGYNLFARDRVLKLDEHVALHPSLAPLQASWQARDLAIVQGVGYPYPNRSHFRSIEIWDTASASNTSRVR